MKERPILFSASMVKAILEGRKTQTRRVVKEPKWAMSGTMEQYDHLIGAVANSSGCIADINCPYGIPGDRLWVRESWKIGAWRGDGRMAIDYLATPEVTNTPWVRATNNAFEERYWIECTDDMSKSGSEPDWEGQWHWEPGQSPTRRRPSIFMPRWASRITLEITDVRVQRVQEISEGDAKAEGAPESVWALHQDKDSLPRSGLTYRSGFHDIWQCINAKRGFGWDTNPWTWALTFSRVA